MEGGGSQEMHVLIIGAGITGLLIAQGLQKSGISYTVFERETLALWAHPKRTWSMMLHWGADYFPDCLPDHLLERVGEVYSDPGYDGTFEGVKIEDGFPYLNGEKGVVLKRVGADSPVRVNRQKMRVLCSEGINVIYNKKLVSFDASDPKIITAHFSDGTSTTGTHLIGADSSRSIVRNILFQNNPDPSLGDVTNIPIHMMSFTQKYSAERARAIRRNFHPISQMAISPTIKSFMLININDVPDPLDPETWIFHIVVVFKYREFNASITQAQNGNANKVEAVTHLGDVFEEFKYIATLGKEEKDDAARVKWLKESCSPYWCEPFRSALAELKEDTYVPDDPVSYWATPSPWENFNGRVTLAGDAAHPITPNRGQGLNNAVRDAAEYVLLLQNIKNTSIEHAKLRSKTQKEMVDKYDKEVLERGMIENDLSLRSSLVSCDWDRLMESPMLRVGMRKLKEGEVV